MKNSQVAQEFINGNSKAKTKNMFIDKNVLYSYGYHFPMALKLNDCYIVNRSKYSPSTSRHQGYFLRAIKGDKIIFVNTAKLKELIQLREENNFNSFIEIKDKLVLIEL